MTDPRRRLPSVDRLLQSPDVRPLLAVNPRAVVVAAVREVLDHARADSQRTPDLIEEIREAVDRLASPTLKPVLNATGVVLHTNLGRAPLASVAIAAMREVASDYCNLEYDLDEGVRGSRQTHCRSLLAELAGAEDALVVNNAAGALALALNEVAERQGVVVSRGELIEIGGSFRIPDIVSKSGAEMIEVGTTNRTHLDDYRAVVEGAAALLTVHRSNFEQTGFVATPDSGQLAALAREAGVPYVHDVGSGLVLDLGPWGLSGEPLVADAVARGATVVIFSGDKLLGGPQAGCLVGSGELMGRCRRNPLARALRADKFTLAALAATLALYRDRQRALEEIPVLRMLTRSAESLAHQAEAIAAACPPEFEPRLVPGRSAVGGGSFPEAGLATTLVELRAPAPGPQALARRLRRGDPSLVARIADDRVLLDPRTLPPESTAQIAGALTRAMER